MPPLSTTQLRDPSQRAVNGASHSPTALNRLKRPRTPNMLDDAPSDQEAIEETARRDSLVRDLRARAERMLNRLFGHAADSSEASDDFLHDAWESQGHNAPIRGVAPTTTFTKSTRVIDEDDYGDEDADGAESPTGEASSSLGLRGTGAPRMIAETSQNSVKHIFKPPLSDQRTPMSNPESAKSSEEALKILEAEKKAAEKAAKESFQTMFYTLETDRDAMLEQQKLDELDQQVETEMSGQDAISANANNNTISGQPKQGTLSSTNLGASSLTLKHLIARIDSKRDRVPATDMQLRTLMSEVRKNRSKWASEDRVGQEELYEAAERVLMELKSMTEYAAPFLQKVNKRDAPDYHNIIKNPMDIGTMIKKLKQLQYRSKKDFVEDLDLIWTNCLKYNADPNHFLRKKAEHMRRETARLTPLIPDVIVRDRAEVEAEERRLHMAEFDGDDDSDEEPIIASRGRKAPSKGTKGTTSRKAAATEDESSPVPASATGAAGPLSQLKNEHLRSDVESATDTGSQHGLSTPPPGNAISFGLNGVPRSGAPGSHADASETEDMRASLRGVGGIISGSTEEPDLEDDDYKTWKHVTKKDRAHIAAERHRLFKSDRINPEEPALLRSKAGMRRWMRQQKSDSTDGVDLTNVGAVINASETAQGTTLAEGIEGDLDRVLPDYYDPLAAVPAINDRLIWLEDSEGQVLQHMEECLRMIPKGYFTSPEGLLPSKIEGNMQQMQDIRKIVTKIGIVKQMQLQTQTYQNQFQKYDPEPFAEVDTEPLVVSDEGPIMAPWVTRYALQRSVGKLFYHAGFEECQPSALEAATDLAGEYLTNLVRTLGVYSETSSNYPERLSKERCTDPSRFARFTNEEQILATLHQNGLDITDLESYAKEEVERLSHKLDVHGARMKDHLTELLRPALDPAVTGVDGAGAFNDGSEQFVGGDILAEEAYEDFFGFKELGLDKEFGLASLSVPFHLLQSRVHNAYQPANASTVMTTGNIMEQPDPYPALTTELLDKQIGLIRSFFQRKFDAADGDDLVEDEDLPAKQRFPKPRLPPTGKISSPRKRPIREQQMLARKKRKLEIEADKQREEATETNGIADVANGQSMLNGSSAASSQKKDDITSNSTSKDDSPMGLGESGSVKGRSTPKAISKLKFDVPQRSDENRGDPEKLVPRDNDEGHTPTGMQTPESLPNPVAAH